MAVFPSFNLTKKGEELLNRSIGEGRVLTFTKFKIGDGVPTENWRDLVDVQSSFKEFPVLETAIQADQVLRIRGYFDNKGFATDKQFKEIGVFVTLDGVAGEHLYSYTNAGDTGDIIPAESRGFYSRTLDVNNYIGYATNITFNIEQTRDNYDFNTENELKVATFLKKGDKVRLWGRLVLGDIETLNYIVTDEVTSFILDNGLYCKLAGDNTVSNIKTDLVNLKGAVVGDVVEVLGFHAKGDGSHHKRVAKAEDDGSGEKGQNGIWWCIVHSGEVNVSWLGAKADIDCADIFQKAINMNIKVTARRSVTYLINSPIIIKGTVNLDFNNAYLTTDIENMTILYNSDDDAINGTIENVRFADWRTTSEKKKFTGIRIGYTTRGMFIRNIRATHVDRVFECGNKIWGKLDIDGLQCQNTVYNDSITVLLNGNTIACRNFDIVGNMEACVKHLGGRPFHLSDSNLAGGSITNAIHMTNVSEYEINNIYIEKVKTVSAVTDEGMYINGGTCGTVREINMAGGNIVLDGSHTKLENIIFSQTSRGLRIKNNSIVNIDGEVNGFFNAQSEASFYTGRITYFNNQSNKPVLTKFFQTNNENVRPKNAGLTTIERTTTDYLTGNTSLKVSSTTTSWQGVYFDFVPNSTGVHTIVAKVKIPSSATNTSLRMVGSTTYTRKPYEATSLKDEWVRISCIIDCIAGQTYRVEMAHIDLPVGEAFYIDNIGVFYGVNYSDIEGYYEPTTIQSLDTPYYTYKMQQEGIYADYVAYRDELHEYEKTQREIEEQRQLAFENRQNQEQSYEEWLVEQPMLMPTNQPPQIPVSVENFAKEYGVI